MRLIKKSLQSHHSKYNFLKYSLFVLCFNFSLSAFTAPAAKGTLAPAPINTFVVNPDSLRKTLLEQNISLMIQLNNVHKAKTQVSISRSRLLPSINLGSMISGAQSFALNSVTMLLPFLLPSNWLNVDQSQYLLDAQTNSYYISQLNTYSSAYSLYLTIVGDLNLRQVLFNQYSTYKDIEELIAQAVDAGMMNEDQLLLSRAQTQLSYIQVSQVDALLIEEKAAIREMLSLPYTTEITFDNTHVNPSSSEQQSISVLLARANEKSPELSQLNSLISAAQAAKWSIAFGFLSGSTLSVNSINGGALDNVVQTGTVNLGFNYFPQIKLANYNIEEIKLQKQQVALAQAHLIESTIGSLKEAAKQYELAQAAEKNLRLFYEAEIEKFRAGMTDLLHVLNAGKSLTTALTNKVSAQIHLDTLRVSLNRILLEEKFSLVNSCSIKRNSGGGFFDKLGKVFTSEDSISLDSACGSQTKK